MNRPPATDEPAAGNVPSGRLLGRAAQARRRAWTLILGAVGVSLGAKDRFEREASPFAREVGPDAPARATPSTPVRGELLGSLLLAGNRAVAALVGDPTASVQRQEAQALEGVADEVAHEHAEPLVRAHGWFGRPGGLDAGHAKRAVGERLGADLSDVTVRSGRLPGAPPGALASALAGTVHVAPGGYDAGTPVGQALLAHELTHVVQQSAGDVLPAGPGPAHADRRRPVGTAPPGMAQHSISCTPSSAPPPVAAATFTEVADTYRKSADPAVRAAALTRGVATARGNAARLYRNADQPPVSTLRLRYEAETGESVSYQNPFIGVSQDHVERAYRAWAENAPSSEPPWVLLAVWVKEGLGEPTPDQSHPTGIPAVSPADARAIYRSLAYFMNFGADVYVAHTAVAGSDNAADFVPGTGAAHDTAFQAQVARQVAAGRLVRDVSAEIDASLAVTPASPGRFTVTASPRFAELSLLLVDAFYREQREALAADPRVGATPDPGLVYMRWNMRASSFDDFLNRAPNPDPGGAVPSREAWAFHRPMPNSEYGQSRRNAMRFKYLLEIFQHAYEDRP